MTKTPYYAQIIWRDSYPYSVQFEDFYFAKTSGTAEACYVFLKHNNLEQRFSNLTKQQAFIIGETGFGAGLNFLSTYQLWQRTKRQKDTQLHYLSIEKYPLKPDDLQQVLNLFPELKEEAKFLLQQYYLLLPGMHRLTFANNIKLTLIIGDIKHSLTQLSHLVDAWFLDGFSPRQNPEMWNPETLSIIASLSHNNTTFATYAAAAKLKHDLCNCGFEVKISHGFASKREMLYGFYNAPTKPNYNKAYFAKPKNLTKTRQVAIIGAGISGAASAYSLATRGYQITIYEQNQATATGASGNYQGILYATWSAFLDLAMELSYPAYRYAHSLIRNLLQAQVEYAECGMIQFYPNQAKRQEQLLNAHLPDDFLSLVNPNQINQLAGTVLTNSDTGLYFPSGLWINPKALVNALLAHPNITLINNCNITQLEHQQEQWHLYNQQQLIGTSAILILANADKINQFQPTKHLNLRLIRGQTTTIAKASPLKTIINAKAYVIPEHQQKFTLGATFQINDHDLNLRLFDHQQNLNNLATILPQLIKDISPQQLDGKASLRVSTYNYLPLLGPIAKYPEFMMDFAKLKHDKNLKLTIKCQYHPNLYLNTAHGTKGMLSAPFCAELLADYIDNTPLACSETLRQALHPNRLYVKELIK